MKPVMAGKITISTIFATLLGIGLLAINSISSVYAVNATIGGNSNGYQCAGSYSNRWKTSNENVATLPSGYTFENVYVKAGQDCVQVFPTNTAGSCYSFSVNGNTVTVNKIGSGSSCKEISHLEGTYGIVSTPSPSSTPTPTPSSSPTGRPTSTPTSTPNASPTPAGTPFVFPLCTDILPAPGDVAHYTSGMHQIVGGPLLSGSDDVYSLPGGNYLQCFCPVEGETGIQTNWLRSDDPVVGWFFENGLQWNLGNFNYAVQNVNFSCNNQTEKTPNPTSTPEPTTGGSSSAPSCPAPKPGTPSILSTVQNGTSITLTWSKVEEATHYSIVYGDIPGTYNYGVANTGNVTSYTINGLVENGIYHFGVIAVNDCMPGDVGKFVGGTGGQILGASVMAETGTFSESIYKAIMGLGGTLTAFGASRLKSKKSKKKAAKKVNKKVASKRKVVKKTSKKK